MTITQTVEIPANRRRLTIDVPREIPAGRAQLEWKVIPFPTKEEKPTSARSKKLFKSKKEMDEYLENAKTPHSDALSGILVQLRDITLEQIRDERLARHLK